jgi:prevent-host-death family protein
MTVLTSRDFNRDVSRAKRAARLAPVFVTDRGKPTHVLMSIEAYRRLAGQAESIVDLLAVADAIDIDPRDARLGAFSDGPR